jgi:hypothetical protein
MGAFRKGEVMTRLTVMLAMAASARRRRAIEGRSYR